MSHTHTKKYWTSPYKSHMFWTVFSTEKMTARSMCFDCSHDSIPMKHVTSPPPQGELCPRMCTADMGQRCCMLGRSCHCTVLGAAIRQQERGRGRTLSALVCFAVSGFTAPVLLSLALVPLHEVLLPIPWLYGKQCSRGWSGKYYFLLMSACVGHAKTMNAPASLSKQVRERQRALISMSTVAVFKFLSV